MTVNSDWLMPDIPLVWTQHPVSTINETVLLAKVDNGVMSLVSVDWNSGEVVGETRIGCSPKYEALVGLYFPISETDILTNRAFGLMRISRK